MDNNDIKAGFGLPDGFTDRVMGAISVEMKTRAHRKGVLLTVLYVLVGISAVVGLFALLSALKVVSFEGLNLWASNMVENPIAVETSAFSTLFSSIGGVFASVFTFFSTIFKNFSSYYFIIILCFNFLILYCLGEFLARQHK